MGLQFTYAVKNGKTLYQPGDEVPSDYPKDALKALKERGHVAKAGKVQEPQEPDQVEEDDSQDDSGDDGKPFNARMKKDELLAAAEEMGVEVDKTMTNKEILEVLEENYNN